MEEEVNANQEQNAMMKKQSVTLHKVAAVLQEEYAVVAIVANIAVIMEPNYGAAPLAHNVVVLEVQNGAAHLHKNVEVLQENVEAKIHAVMEELIALQNQLAVVQAVAFAV